MHFGRYDVDLLAEVLADALMFGSIMPAAVLARRKLARDIYLERRWVQRLSRRIYVWLTTSAGSGPIGAWVASAWISASPKDLTVLTNYKAAFRARGPVMPRSDRGAEFVLKHGFANPS